MRAPWRLAALLSSLAGLATGQDLVLQLPVDCTLGDAGQCFVQQYMDRDPGPDARDFTCQRLSYDGHQGTDFALRSFAEIAHGVDVLAAAPGRVTGVRDGMADIAFRPEHADALRGRECGNGVVIDHGGGWETQYCHLRQGSVRVTRGDVVKAGDVLGEIGMSGRAAFAHVHLSVRKDGTHIDPYAPGDIARCAATPAADTLWADPPAYQPTGLIAAGFATAVPEYSAIKAGTAHVPRAAQTAPALVLWGYAFGSHPGDTMRFEITDADGVVVLRNTVNLTKHQAQYFRANGRKTQGAAWFRPGTYRGQVTLLRGGDVVSQRQSEITITH